MADKKNWIGPAVERMKRKGTVGKFSASAKRAGMSTSAYANKVLVNKNASQTQRKRANFAKNVRG